MRNVVAKRVYRLAPPSPRRGTQARNFRKTNITFRLQSLFAAVYDKRRFRVRFALVCRENKRPCGEEGGKKTKKKKNEKNTSVLQVRARCSYNKTRALVSVSSRSSTGTSNAHDRYVVTRCVRLLIFFSIFISFIINSRMAMPAIGRRIPYT